MLQQALRLLLSLRAYDGVRIILGLVLLTAAALKGYQLTSKPLLENGLFSSRWLLIGLVEFELLFGLWLLSGLYPRPTRYVGLLSFGAFASVALSQAIGGEASCGCFGSVPISPWVTLILDLAALTLLWRCQPRVHSSASIRVRKSRFATFAISSLIVAVLAGIKMTSSQQLSSFSTGKQIESGNEFVVLSPKDWVGRRFPLIEHIDLGDQLAIGDWIIVFYHNDCSKCRQVIPRYQALALKQGQMADAPSIALIEIPPHRGAISRTNSPCALGRLKESRKWFMQTPAEISLSGAIVQGVKSSAEIETKSINFRHSIIKGRKEL